LIAHAFGVLENELSRQLYATRITGENLIPLLERRCSWNKRVMNVDVGLARRRYIVQEPSRILRMVEDVARTDGKLDFRVFLDGETLKKRKIDIIDRIEL
jgi:hypothetical protein